MKGLHRLINECKRSEIRLEQLGQYLSDAQKEIAAGKQSYHQAKWFSDVFGLNLDYKQTLELSHVIRRGDWKEQLRLYGA